MCPVEFRVPSALVPPPRLPPVAPSSLRSRPAQNAGSAPVRISTSTSSRVSASCITFGNRRRSSLDRALRALGRLSVIVAIRSRTSRRTGASSAVIGTPCRRCERASASERAAGNGLRGRGTQGRSSGHHVDDASERAPASERPGTACVAGERRGGHRDTMSTMRASERQRASGRERPAWPGNAGTVIGTPCRRCERASASERAAGNGLRGRGTQGRSSGHHVDDASERAPASERPGTACVAGERSDGHRDILVGDVARRERGVLSRCCRPRPAGRRSAGRRGARASMPPIRRAPRSARRAASWCRRPASPRPARRAPRR